MGFLDRHFGGHLNIGSRITIYGYNAMHVAINVYTERWGWICFHPTWKVFGKWWKWYFYVSPDATPYRASIAFGPGLRD